jgi:hypothetical protein
MTPVNMGRFSKGRMRAMMIKAPEVIPAQPMPATALPTIRTREDGAAAQTMEPTSKTHRAKRKIHVALYSMYSFPNMSWKQQVVRRNDEPYQATSSRESNSEVILGMAVEMMERSCCRVC